MITVTLPPIVPSFEKFCPRAHNNPMDAEFCSQCGEPFIMETTRREQEQSEILFQEKSNMVSNWACAYILADTTIPLDEWMKIRVAWGEASEEEVELVLDGRCPQCAMEFTVGCDC